MKQLLLRLCLASTALALPLGAAAQSLRGITSINNSRMSLPALTITGVSLSTTADGELVETTTGLDRLRVEIPTSSNTKTVIETYTGTSVEEVTLFEPRTFTNSNAGTRVVDQGPEDDYPFICGAAAPGQAANVSGTYNDPSGASMFTGPGEAPKNYAGEDANSVTGGNPNPNPLAGAVLSAGTMFARQPYLSSGSFGNGLPNTAPLQLTPFPSGVAYPDCGG